MGSLIPGSGNPTEGSISNIGSDQLISPYSTELSDEETAQVNAEMDTATCSAAEILLDTDWDTLGIVQKQELLVSVLDSLKEFNSSDALRDHLLEFVQSRSLKEHSVQNTMVSPQLTDTTNSE